MDGSIPQKTCSKCGKTYPATSEYFHRHGDGLRAYCKVCALESHKHYYEENRDKVREGQKRHYEENREKVLEGRKRYYEENADKERQLAKRWREENPEYNKRYREENADKERERHKQYYEENPDKVKAKAHKRRARLAAADGTHTDADVEAQVASQTKDGKLYCWWCGKPIKRKYHVDHRIPLSKGGSNDPGNLCITHAKCNLSKHDKMPWEFNGRLL